MALIRIQTHHLKKGMIIKADVYNRAGVILVPKGTPVTAEVFELLTKHFIDDVIVDYVTETATISELSEEKALLRKKRLQEFTRAYQIA